MTRAEIRTIARKRLGETTSAFWTDAELNTYINLGCKDVAWRVKCLRATGQIAVASCEPNLTATISNEFVISSNLTKCYAINEVYFRNEQKDYVRLIPTTREELDLIDDSWQSLVGWEYLNTTSGVTTYNYESQTTEPTHYYWNREEDVFGVYPPPNDENDGGLCKIYFSKEHTDLSSDSAVPQIPSGIHLAIIDFTVASGLEDRGWGDRANDMWNKYVMKLKDYTVEKKNEREDDLTVMKNYRNI